MHGVPFRSAFGIVPDLPVSCMWIVVATFFRAASDKILMVKQRDFLPIMAGYSAFAWLAVNSPWLPVRRMDLVLPIWNTSNLIMACLYLRVSYERTLIRMGTSQPSMELLSLTLTWT